MLFDDNFAADFLIADNNDKLITFNTYDRKGAEELLLELEQNINSESAWLNNNASLTAAVPETPVPSVSPATEVDDKQFKNTDELLVEFETVCNAVGVTPPPSPPQNLFEGVPIYYIVAEEASAPSSPVTVDLESLASSQSVQPLLDSIAASIADDSSADFIDELVRTHSSQLPDFDYDFDDDDGVSSNDSFSDASGKSPQSDSGLSPRSDSGSSFAGFSMDGDDDDDEEDEDEEWAPSLAPEPKSKKSSRSSSAGKPEKRQKRAYGRAPEEKKVRKKEQNKNAATRYRQKKKQQLEDILRDEEGLKAVHRSLQTQYDDVKREINYLKKLMREVLIAKGVKM